MSTSSELEHLRREMPRCTAIAWFQGSPLQLVAASGAPDTAAWPSWDAVARAAPVLLADGPVSSTEVLLRLPATMMLLAERATGVVAVIVELTPAGTGVALVQARIAASRVGE